MGAMEQEVLLCQARVDCKFYFLTIVDEVVGEEVFFGSFDDEH